jgi:hypothetical protein
VLRLLAQVKRVPRVEVSRLLASTYGGFLRGRGDPGWHARTVAEVEALLAHMTELGLADEEDGFVRLTPLGRACGNSSLAFRSAMRLVRLLRAQEGARLTAERLMAFVQALPELDAFYTPIMRRGQGETRWAQEVIRVYGPPVARVLQHQVEDEWTFAARCKRASILKAWIAGTPLEAIERIATANPFNEVRAGTIRGLADTTRFHLRAAHKIATALLLTDGPGEDEIDALLRRLEVGLPEDVLDLLRLPVALSRGEYLALRDAGVRNRQSLWAQPEAILSSILAKASLAELMRLKPREEAIARPH